MTDSKGLCRALCVCVCVSVWITIQNLIYRVSKLVGGGGLHDGHRLP